VYCATAGTGAAEPRLAQLADAALLAEQPLECTELQIRVRGTGHLLVDQIGPLTAETVQLEQEPADVAHLHLAQLAQVACAPTDPAALEEPELGLIEVVGVVRL
jgi:hypothetical protein